MSSKNNITAKDLLNLLLTKHHDDLCVPECKDGPTQGRKGHLRLDLWVMKRSWTKPHTIGYEIKVDRNDFLRDEKWHQYLDLCSDFYFVAPPGIISPDELPKEAGLLISSVNAKMLYTKKKAMSRLDTVLPETLYRYILMCRSRIQDRDLTSTTLLHKKEYWQRWLQDKQINREFGRYVSLSIAQRVKTEINDVRKENESLRKENETLEEVKYRLQKLGMPDEEIQCLSRFRVDQFFRDMNNIVPNGLAWQLHDTLRNLKKLEELINEFQEKSVV